MATTGRGDAVQVDGLKELVRDLGGVNRDVRTQLKRELAKSAEIVAEEARQIAEQKGLRRTGRLIARIRTGVKNTSAYVTDTARNQGYNYPGLLEYAGSATRRAGVANYGDHKIRNRSTTGVRMIAQFGASDAHYGPRAFLNPALQAKRPEVERAFEQFLDKVIDSNGFTGGAAA